MELPRETPLPDAPHPGARSRRRHAPPMRYLSDLVVTGALAGFLALALYVVGRLGVVFGESRVGEPGITRILLGVQSTYVHYFGWAFLLAIALLAPLALSQADRRRRRRWFLAGYLLVGGLILAMLIGLMIPLIHLARG